MDNILRFYISLLFPKIICQTIDFSHVFPLRNVTTKNPPNPLPPNVWLTFLVEQIDMRGFPNLMAPEKSRHGRMSDFRAGPPG